MVASGPLKWTALSVLAVVGAVTAGLLFHTSRSREDSNSSSVFEAVSTDHANSWLNSIESLAHEMDILTKTVPLGIDADQSLIFDTISGLIRSHRSSIFAISYCPRVTLEERAEFEEFHSRRVGLNYTVRIGDASNGGGASKVGDLPVAGDRDNYFPIVYSTILGDDYNNSNLAFLFDVASVVESNAPRRTQLLAALEANAPQASEPFPISGSVGSVVIFPMFPASLNVSAIPPADRIQNSTGIVTLVLLSSTLSISVLDNIVEDDLVLRFDDITTPENSMFFFAVVKGTSGREPSLAQADVDDLDQTTHLTTRVDQKFFQRDLRLTSVATSKFEQRFKTPAPYIILGAVLLLAVGSGTIVWFVYASLAAAARAVQLEADTKNEMRLAQAKAARAAHESSLRFVCHEVRNPLHSIGASLAFLRDDSTLRAEQRRDIESIDTAAKQMLRIVNDTLDVARLEAGTIKIVNSTTHPRVVMTSVHQLFMPLCRPGVTFSVFTAPDVPEAVVLDELRVRQAISNGITNSLKFTDTGFVVAQVSKVAGVDALLFQVIDSGPGLSGKDPHLLLDPSNNHDWGSEPPYPVDVGRLLETPEVSALAAQDSAYHDNLESSGFGLPISFSLAHCMGGRCGLLEEAGHTVFWLYVPYLTSEAPVFSAVHGVVHDGDPKNMPSMEGASEASSQSLSSGARGSGHHSSPPPELKDGSQSPPERTQPHVLPNSTTSMSRYEVTAVSQRGAWDEVTAGAGAGAGTGAGAGAGTGAWAPIGTPANTSSVVSSRPALSRISLDLHVLVVDDELVNRRVAARMLKRLGCSCIQLEDGYLVNAALHARNQLPASLVTSSLSFPTTDAPSKQFDVVMVDIQMPGVNGDEVCRQLVQGGFDPKETPIVAMTGNSSPEQIQEYLDMGFTAVLGKPFDLGDLRATLLEVKAAVSP